MDKSKIEQLIKLNSKNQKYVKANDIYECHFSNLHTLDDSPFYFFGPFEKNNSCPRQSSYAEVSIINKNSNEEDFGKLYVNLDEDLGEHGYYSISLVIMNKETNKVKKIITIVDFSFEDQL